jgi:predicted phosphate transport protein (TIGR00153 family)
MNLLPRDPAFSHLFERHVSIVCQASELLVAGLSAGYAGACGISAEMKKLEREGDNILRDIAHKLQETFLTPFEPEDVRALATALDDVLDYMENATFRIVAYRMEPVPPAMIDLSRIVDKSCACLRQAVHNVFRRQPLIEDCIAIDRLEKEADALERRFLADLFRQEHEPVTLLKQKELFEALEAVTDRCDDVANVLERVSLKRSA